MARRFKFRIGVLVPFTNTNLEPDLALMRPADVSFHYSRIGGYNQEEIPDEAAMADMGAADIVDGIRLIAATRPDLILYGCTSATLTHGLEFDSKLAAEISRIAGTKTITAAGSLITALAAIGANNVGFASPYVGDINHKASLFLASAGIRVVNCASINSNLNSYEQGELSPEEIFELALRADHKDAEAIVLACTDLRAIEVIPKIESELGKIVISTNQAMLFAASAMLNLAPDDNLVGGLSKYLQAVNT
ncbi:MAG: Asp/Glu racemase [Gammaproteobacteria bacterium]|nr:Asp/Glu racemase [Gammaproteobacteria bacterium]